MIEDRHASILPASRDTAHEHLLRQWTFGDRKAPMKLEHLVRFVALAEHLHFPRAAQALGIALPALYSTLDKLEEEVGHLLVIRDAPTRLTPAGTLLLDEARARIADAPAAAVRSKAPGGGKAKASKGKGRAPIVKGQPKPYKKRQGR
jgi:hypothetical protein